MKAGNFDVIIIGGSYAGLAAAMSLGRAMWNVLVIDSNNPCNRQSPQAHNFITHDGESPQAIAALAKEQVEQYHTVSFMQGIVTHAEKNEGHFLVQTEQKELFTAKKLVFATGLTDIMPDIKDFSICWGISVLHCPFCHGYEVKGEPTAIICNGSMAVTLCKTISNWTKELTLFTNGKSTIDEADAKRIQQHGINIIAQPISHLQHTDGHVRAIVFKDGSMQPVKAIYYHPEFKQQCLLPITLGCRLNEHGLIDTDIFHRTCVDGVYAAGDNSTFGRSISVAVSSGNVAGMMLHKELVEERF